MRARLIRTGSYVVVFAIATISVLWLTIFRDAGSRPAGDERESIAVEGPTNSDQADHAKPSENPVVSTPSSAQLSPADVLGNKDCRMTPGAGHGRSMALVLMPDANGSRFAVVDGSGVVFGDVLPLRTSAQKTSEAPPQTDEP